MNEHTISLVKEHFDLVTPITPQAAALFYAHLFEAYPQFKPLFKGDGRAGACADADDRAWTEADGVLSNTMEEAAAVPA